MKKSIVMLVFAFATLSLVSCKDGDKKAEEMHAGHEYAHYMCPMDCEKGKFYEAEGKCPVCGMDLVEVKDVPPAPAPENHEGHGHSEEGHEGHNH